MAEVWLPELSNKLYFENLNQGKHQVIHRSE